MRALLCLLCLLCSGLAQADCRSARLTGVNLSGAEFATEHLPGVLGTDYAYPSREDLAFFKATGMNTIRLPFRWERVQHTPFAALDAAELAQIGKVLAWSRAMDLCLVLDLHNYGSFGTQAIGSPSISPRAFEDVWLRLLAAFPDPAHTAFGLMNEPAAMPVPQWMALAQSTVLALRQAGARHLLLVGSGRWSGAHEWAKSYDGVTAAEAFASFRDPLNHYAVELHQYADPGYTGTRFECVKPAELTAAMQTLARWSKVHRVRFFMGEFAMAGTPDCLVDLRALLEPMQDGSVWLGWTWWTAGARWGPYPFNIHPNGGPEAPQLTVLREFLPGGSAKASP
jgi:endoglucanase